MQSYDPDIQRYDPPAIMLSALLGGSGVGGTFTVDFAVPLVDSRIRTKVTVMYVPLDGNNPNIFFDTAQSLWLALREEDRSGRRGCMITIAHLFGTALAPVSIIGDSQASGFSREFVSAGDEIFGRLTCNGVSQPGRWMLQVRYQADGLRMTDCEWSKLKAFMTPAVRSDPPVVAGSQA